MNLKYFLTSWLLLVAMKAFSAHPAAPTEDYLKVECQHRLESWSEFYPKDDYDPQKSCIKVPSLMKRIEELEADRFGNQYHENQPDYKDKIRLKYIHNMTSYEDRSAVLAVPTIVHLLDLKNADYTARKETKEAAIEFLLALGEQALDELFQMLDENLVQNFCFIDEISQVILKIAPEKKSDVLSAISNGWQQIQKIDNGYYTLGQDIHKECKTKLHNTAISKDAIVLDYYLNFVNLIKSDFNKEEPLYKEILHDYITKHFPKSYYHLDIETLEEFYGASPENKETLRNVFNDLFENLPGEIYSYSSYIKFYLKNYPSDALEKFNDKATSIARRTNGNIDFKTYSQFSHLFNAACNASPRDYNRTGQELLKHIEYIHSEGYGERKEQLLSDLYPNFNKSCGENLSTEEIKSIQNILVSNFPGKDGNQNSGYRHNIESVSLSLLQKSLPLTCEAQEVAWEHLTKTLNRPKNEVNVFCPSLLDWSGSKKRFLHNDRASRDITGRSLVNLTKLLTQSGFAPNQAEIPMAITRCDTPDVTRVSAFDLFSTKKELKKATVDLFQKVCSSFDGYKLKTKTTKSECDRNDVCIVTVEGICKK